MTSIIVIVGIFIFFLVHFLYTQIIYSKNYFLLLIVLACIMPTIVAIFFNRTNLLVKINASSICLYYAAALFMVKRWYKKMNGFFIQKKIINPNFSGKDFTYVLWDGDVPSLGIWWNKKLATKPSSLDYSLTIALLLVPLALFGLINYIWG